MPPTGYETVVHSSYDLMKDFQPSLAALVALGAAAIAYRSTQSAQKAKIIADKAIAEELVKSQRAAFDVAFTGTLAQLRRMLGDRRLFLEQVTMFAHQCIPHQNSSLENYEIARNADLRVCQLAPELLRFQPLLPQLALLTMSWNDLSMIPARQLEDLQAITYEVARCDEHWLVLTRKIEDKLAIWYYSDFQETLRVTVLALEGVTKRKPELQGVDGYPSRVRP